ncbi:hypothetical protein [Falsiroseomonas sp. HW251]|uniref:hypothetical protein n=1 Tax=Falsiroseomonas sp. HW251 TaxID=3390998 RepID=UPI003D3222C5
MSTVPARADMMPHATEWVAASNRRDLERCGTARQARLDTLEFTCLDLVCGVQAQSLHHRARLGATIVRPCGLFRFERRRKVCVEALHGDADANSVSFETVADGVPG